MKIPPMSAIGKFADILTAAKEAALAVTK